MQPNILSIIPPIAVLILAFYTRRILTSIIIGIILATIIATDFNILKAIILTLNSFKEKALDIDNIFTFAFLIFLGITLIIITKTGGTIVIGELITKRIRSSKGVQTASISLSMMLAIDDYLNCLTAGFVMKPLSNKFKIARIKISFLVNSMTAPMTILIPISSWAGMILRQFSESGITNQISEKPIFFADPLFTYLETIPFIFYSFITIISTWFIVRNDISFGLIKKHEEIANKTGNLFGGKDIKETSSSTKISNPSLLDFFAPMTILFSGFILGILYTGNYYLLGGNNGIVESFKQANIFPVLFWIGLATLASSIILALARNKIQLHELPQIISEGTKLMLPAILLIFCAWTFSTILKDHLKTGSFLAAHLLKNLSPKLMPLILFLTTATVSIIIGSSWGTIALMLPMATEIISNFTGATLPISPASLCIFFPSIGAVLSGAVAGNHLSPIADVSIMSSTSTGANHLDHVKGQFYYAIPIFIATSVEYLISGIMSCDNKLFVFLASVGTGVAISILSLYALNKTSNRI